jgi:hypothetical protein
MEEFDEFIKKLVEEGRHDEARKLAYLAAVVKARRAS